MPKIMFRCPVFGTAVPTGLTTEQIMFDSLPPDLEMPMRCPACMKFHNWEPKDAWIEKMSAPLLPGRAGTQSEMRPQLIGLPHRILSHLELTHAALVERSDAKRDLR